MKLAAVSAVILGLSGIKAASASSSFLLDEESLTKVAIEAIASHKPEISSRLLAVSEQCNKETETIMKDDSIVGAETSMGYCVASKTTTDMNQNTKTVKQSVNYDECSGDYVSACSKLDGQLFKTDILIDCSVKAQGQRVRVQMDANNIPACIGKSCDGDEIKEERQKEFNEFVKVLQEGVSRESGGSATCVSTVGSQTSIASDSDKSEESSGFDKAKENAQEAKEQFKEVVNTAPNEWTTGQKAGVAVGCIAVVLILLCIIKKCFCL